MVCRCHGLFGGIYCSKGEIEKAVDHYETALGITSPFNWHDQLFWNNFYLGWLFLSEKRFGDAHAHAERAKLYTINDTYLLGRVTEQGAIIWYEEHEFEEVMSEGLYAADAFENLRATEGAERCRSLLHDIEEVMKKLVTSGEFGPGGELLEVTLLPTPVNSLFLA